MASSKDEIIKKVKSFLEIIRKEHDVTQAYLFGSSATGSAKYYSDIDLAIVLKTLACSEESPFDEEFEIFHEAQKYNSSFEVVCFVQSEFNRNNNSIVKHIKNQGIKLL